MPHKTSISEAWETRKESAVACRRLLISVPCFILSIGIRHGITISSNKTFWMAWLASMALAIVACVFAAEVALGTRSSSKGKDIPFYISVAKTVLWFSVFWICYLALVVFFKIISPL